MAAFSSAFARRALCLAFMGKNAGFAVELPAIAAQPAI
jgi:hypothetical protein